MSKTKWGPLHLSVGFLGDNHSLASLDIVTCVDVLLFAWL